MKASDQSKLAEAIDRMIDGDLSADDARWLDQVLLNDEEARSLYLDLAGANAHLYLHWPQLEQQNIEPPPAVVYKKNPFWSRNAALVLAACASVLVIAGSYVFTGNSERDALTEESSAMVTRVSRTVATLTSCNDVQWGESTLPTTLNSPLEPGRLRLKQGQCTIYFESGAVVSLSGDVDFELTSKMVAKLHSGAALVKVPPSARGFEVSTPNIKAIDFGTEFLISFSQLDNTSQVQVLSGEVQVWHPASGKARGLSVGEAVRITPEHAFEKMEFTGSDEYFKRVEQEGLPRNTLRISTAMGRGRDASVVQSNIPRLLDPALVLVKNCRTDYRRKGYLAFDLDPIHDQEFKNARLILTLQDKYWSTIRLPYDVVFSVFGITDESLDDWSAKDIQWENAPANIDDAAEFAPEQSIKLGSVRVLGARAEGQVILDDPRLTEFLKADTNGVVTLGLVRDFPVSTPSYSTVNGFASRRHATQLPPTLEVELLSTEQSETQTEAVSDNGSEEASAAE
ncbi:FecR domain-containing protein [Neorhodopirellula lusitana]|uniref:FecR domain-containing protein n=1 Tax=Neorhodopirellula lusitana TaxID=445327 RepID=UPI003850119A